MHQILHLFTLDIMHSYGTGYIVNALNALLCRYKKLRKSMGDCTKILFLEGQESGSETGHEFA